MSLCGLARDGLDDIPAVAFRLRDCAEARTVDARRFCVPTEVLLAIAREIQAELRRRGRIGPSEVKTWPNGR